MCGICGIVRQRRKPEDRETVSRMMEALRHRGPDSSGMYIDDTCTIGHTRLSIIDLAGGAQPMSNESESLWLSFNGEIYNYRELRDTLRTKGHIFRTKSDSEVILHAWEEWNTGAFCKFNGQWALALWDAQANELVLSVDPYGIRPVYYHKDRTDVLFASEIKALFQDRNLERALDLNGLKEVYSTWGLVTNRTCFEKIRRLLPGKYLIFRNGEMTTGDYRDDLLTKPPENSSDINPDGIKQALINAAQLRFSRSDVPVGAYLSGGLDSSIIVSILSRHTDVRLQTFSIRFGDAEYDEGDFQSALACEMGTEHHSVLVTDEQIMEAFPSVIAHTEQPLLRTAPIPMYLLSQLVRSNGYKVVVTGEGADEFFAGYDIFKETAVRDAILRGEDDQMIAEMIESLYPWMARSPGSTRGMGRSFFNRNLRSDDPLMSHRTRWDNGTPLVGMLEGEPNASITGSLINSLPEGFEEWSPIMKAQWLEVRTLLNGYLLSAQGDRMLMANSVEGRFPFLDPNVTRMANSLPVSRKLSGTMTEKAILKEAFEGTIPERINRRPKQPYRAPDAAALFKGSPQPWMEEIMSDEYITSTGIMRPQVVKNLFEKCRKMKGLKMSNRDNMMAVAAVSTLLLHDQFIKNPPIADKRQPDLVVDRCLRY